MRDKQNVQRIDLRNLLYLDGSSALKAKGLLDNIVILEDLGLYGIYFLVHLPIAISSSKSITWRYS